jgi:glucosamine--fructose-6-phosphate aminotransferase (isomerizing)
MCGIIGYVGKANATPILLDGLKRLEYRGYDSAGVAVSGNGGVVIRRTEGKLSKLEQLVSEQPISGSSGIGHTRWATHGRPTETNAHPHRSGDIVIVHNGIIENYAELKRFLGQQGHSFSSETDSEVICHLIDNFYQSEGDTLKAVKLAAEKLAGSYSVVIMNVREPDRLYVAKRGSPLVLGESEGERFVASDIPALLPYTKEMRFLEDGDCAVLSAEGLRLYDGLGQSVDRPLRNIPWTPLMAERGGYKHYMLKEIFEQPNVIEDVLAGRIDRSAGRVVLDEISSLFDQGGPKFDRIVIVACGTSLHAGMVGKYLIESLSRIPVTVDCASEFRYREPLLDGHTLVVPISQSGETADTLAALKLSREFGASVMAICNVVGSSITRAADATLYTHAGPEIGVASTKAFTAQLAVLYLFGLYLADRRGMLDAKVSASRVDELISLPRLMKSVLESAPSIRSIAEHVADASHVLYIGRGTNFPVALEGALKLKEISYVHAEGFAAGEMKHGPIALVDHGVPVVAVATRGATYEKVLSNIEEVRARGAEVIVLATEGDEEILKKAKECIFLPRVSCYVAPMLSALPLQLLAYYVADHKGTDVDQPRNLAKSVTVE